jgi:hypothetical protein
VAVTVTVNAELEAAGAVYVADVDVWPDSVPPPLTLHVTPSPFLSFVTIAVSVTLSVASTIVAEAVTATLGELEPPPPCELAPPPPPQPDRQRAATIVRPGRTSFFQNIDAS